MQEEVEMRTVTMAFHASKFSGRVMKNGIAKLLHAMHGKLTVPHGKQSVRQLARQNQGMTNIEIDDPDIHGSDTATSLLRQIFTLILTFNQKYLRQKQC